MPPAAAEPRSLRWAGRRGECTGRTGVVGAFVCGLTPLGATTGAQERGAGAPNTADAGDLGFGPWFESWGIPGESLMLSTYSFFHTCFPPTFMKLSAGP